MNITTKFGLCDAVKITHVNTPGRIIAIVFSGDGLEYRVRYWMDGELRSDLFVESELE